MTLVNTPRSARLLLAALGLCGLLGPARPAQADAPKPLVPRAKALPRVFDGAAGFARAFTYGVAVEATLLGVFWAVRSRYNADQAADLAKPLSGAQGIGACQKPVPANVVACDALAYRLSARDIDADYSVGAFVLGGVASAAATVSIWLWRTPGDSYWLPDLWKVSPTVGPKSGGVILQGAW